MSSRHIISLLSFRGNDNYANLARTKETEFAVFDTRNTLWPLRYLKRGRSNNPALFISLVQVVTSEIYKPVRVRARAGTSWDRKSLTANLLPPQELGLVCGVLGAVYDSEIVYLPSWISDENEEHGLSFQTKPAPANGA